MIWIALGLLVWGFFLVFGLALCKAAAKPVPPIFRDDRSA